MKFIGNIIWFLFFGLWSGLVWLVVGLLWCITILGIPVGLQCFKIAGLSMWPFGKEINIGTKASSIILNLLWLVFGGLELALGNLIAGVVWCCTIIGIPFGLQCFKLAQLSLLPFDAEIK